MPTSLVGRVPPVPASSVAEAFSAQRGIQQAAVDHLAAGHFGRQAVLGELCEVRILARSRPNPFSLLCRPAFRRTMLTWRSGQQFVF